MSRDWSARLEAFAGELEAALGDNLVSLVLYGSAARPGYHPGQSDLNLLLVLRDARPAALRPIGGQIGRWARHQAPPLIVSEHGWRASADVFAMEIEDMRQAHRVLRGANPFAGLETSPADLRGELEREARGKLIQLRSHFAAAESDGRALGDLLEASAGTFFVLLRAVLRLRGHVPPLEPAALVALAADVAGFDARAFSWPVARLTGQRPRRLEPFDAAGEAYVTAVEQLVDFIDRLD